MRENEKIGVGNGVVFDLVAGDTVYEVKKELKRSELYQAKGQGLTYAGILGKRRVVVVGQLPEDDEERKSALNIAENITLAGYVKVSFIELDPFWGIAPPSPTTILVRVAAAILIIGLLVLGVTKGKPVLCRAPDNPPTFCDQVERR